MSGVLSGFGMDGVGLRCEWLSDVFWEGGEEGGWDAYNQHTCTKIILTNCVLSRVAAPSMNLSFSMVDFNKEGAFEKAITDKTKVSVIFCDS